MTAEDYLSQYRRSSRQCNQSTEMNQLQAQRLNTAEAVDNVITMITNDLQKNSIIGLCRKGLSLNKDYIFFP